MHPLKKNKVLAAMLLLLALIILIGLFVGYGVWWEVVDVAAMVICAWAGIFLLTKK
jgi:hypothetical protein